MAEKSITLGLLAILAAMLWASASAQSSSCTSALINLSPCLNFITGNETSPSDSCCSQLKSIVSSEPQCLCTVLNGGASSLGITINQTQALALPGACKVQTPPVSKCNSNGGSSPTNSPTTPSSSSPTDSNTPSDDGSKTIPTGGFGSSDGSSIHAPFAFTLCSLFMVAYQSASYSF